MFITVYVLAVLTVNDGRPFYNFTEYKTFDECIDAQVTVEVLTNSFAKCIVDKKEQI